MALNVLIVDDSAVMRTMVLRTLRLSGLPLGEVHEAPDGQAGLEVLQAHWVDLVLLDLNMPRMNGEELLGEIRGNPETASVAVIVVSTEGSDARIALIHKLGAGFVHKPFRPEQLRAEILQLTGMQDDAHETSAVAADGSGDF
ncbi:MAG: response regulator [Gemmatimonadetes bacterium]|nr:response regulator [Gemmatimonadota bacterium]MBI3569278.1 response regulator [Gemmatimonadota bacterium]